MKRVYLFIAIFLLCCFYGFSQHQKIDSIIATVTTKKDSVAFDLISSEIKSLWIQEQYDIVLSYENQLLTIAKDLEYNKGIGDVYMNIGNTYNTKYSHSKAFQYYDKASIYYRIAKNERGLAIIDNNKSTIEQGRGNVEAAIDYIHKANLYFEKIKDTLALSSTYNNLANIYSDIGDMESAKTYYLKSVDLKRITNSPKLSSSLDNLALLYIDTNELDKAEFLLFESLKVAKKTNNHHYKTQAYNRLGSIHLAKKEYPTSKKYYDSSYQSAIKSQNAKLVANAKQQLGFVAIEIKDYNTSNKWLLDAQNDLKKLKTAPLLLTNYSYLSTLESRRKNYKQAFFWQKKYQELSDANIKEEHAANIKLAEKKYQSDIEEQQRIDEQEKRELLAKQELLVYKIFTIISLLSSITFFVFLLYVIRSRKERKKYIKELNESNQVKNKLFSIISHDLKNEIHGLDGSLNLLKDNAVSSEEFQEIVPLLANRTHQTSILLNNLLNWSKSQLKELHANPILFNVNTIINEKFIFFDQKAKQKNIKLKNHLIDSTMVVADQDMFAIVSQNLLANAIKFCNSEDTITITSTEEEEYFKICFQDTGVGIAAENLHKLFAEDTYTTQGTQQETGTGLGLRICKELIELNKGSISVESTLGVGTTFCITLPKESKLQPTQSDRQ